EIGGAENLELLPAVAGKGDMRAVGRDGQLVRVGAGGHLMGLLAGREVDPDERVRALVGNQHRAGDGIGGLDGGGSGAGGGEQGGGSDRTDDHHGLPRRTAAQAYRMDFELSSFPS